jgi:6-phosphofructokinase 1
MATFGILVGGGPAPGINGVIGAATILARRSGAEVLGIREGFRWLMQGDTSHVEPLYIADVSRIRPMGGSILLTARTNPTKRTEDMERVIASLDELGIDNLVTIGGDDTAFSAFNVAEKAGGRIRVAHVPKTIDNDLPLPPGVPTFGFETARETGGRLLSHLMEDARTTRRWYFSVVMGRNAGHLALGAGTAAGVTLFLIPEHFPPGRIRFQTIANLLEGAIIKRRVMGRPYGVAVIAEGVGERLDPEDVEVLKDVERDEHGHIRLSEVPLGRFLRNTIRDSLAERGIKVTIVEKDVGYELRCAAPNAYDLNYTLDLGAGAVRTLLDGESGVMITRQGETIVTLPLREMIDPETGRTRVRLVNVDSASHQNAWALQVRMEESDLTDPESLKIIAETARISPEAAKERYWPVR